MKQDPDPDASGLQMFVKRPGQEAPVLPVCETETQMSFLPFHVLWLSRLKT